MIKGGYILQPRKIDESEVSKCPPHVREIWLYLLRKAFYKDGNKLKRGQLLTSYSQIINDLSWKIGYRTERYKKHHCGTAMKLLTKLGMIATTKTTRGMIVTILNYDYYQDPNNYETNNETNNKQTRSKQSSDTIDKEREEGKKERINIPFEKFWDLYDKKKGDKGKCQVKWEKLKDKEREAIMEFLPKWKQGIKDKQFQPFPATFLNQRRWESEDEIEQAEVKRDKNFYQTISQK